MHSGGQGRLAGKAGQQQGGRSFRESSTSSPLGLSLGGACSQAWSGNCQAGAPRPSILHPGKPLAPSKGAYPGGPEPSLLPPGVAGQGRGVKKCLHPVGPPS